MWRSAGSSYHARTSLVPASDPEKMKALFRRFSTRRMSEDVAAPEYEIAQGKGLLS